MNRLEKQKQFEQEFKEKAKQLHNDKYDYSNVVYVNSRSKVTIICPKHGSFEQRVSSHLLGNGCPKCKMSKLEKLVDKMLDKHDEAEYFLLKNETKFI